MFGRWQVHCQMLGFVLVWHTQIQILYVYVLSLWEQGGRCCCHVQCVLLYIIFVMKRYSLDEKERKMLVSLLIIPGKCQQPKN